MEVDICKLSKLDDDTELRRLCEGRTTSLLIVTDTDAESGKKVLTPDAGDFVKWLGTNTQYVVEAQRPDQRRMLRDASIWLPLVYLANECGLPIFLNLVSSYLYERMKGALRGDVHRISVRAAYVDSKTGVSKLFTFEGGEEALRSAIKKVDLNEFFDK